MRVYYYIENRGVEWWGDVFVAIAVKDEDEEVVVVVVVVGEF